ncbi:imidazolonepropionase [Alteromonas mediterranea]|uniref:imidazolonepropionase n=1 Tax=Alteromonas mediterranea TaxID=314275 RepID=UPI00035582A2|nr:imidazolonepropionase [Alteromonas mediterranea]AGP88898.1 imidazolonepropionase [Alteromonas mediterranea U7]AGP92991.1 imidazolonepropionase [Alteromonas mediterranea U8]
MKNDFKKYGWDNLWVNAQIATMSSEVDAPYGLKPNCSIATRGDRIVWIGEEDSLPREAFPSTKNVIDCQGKLVTPGLIDCHTHLVHAGDRCNEFEMRLNGASYEEIALAGGGIVSTVNATRKSSEDELFNESASRLERLMRDGVTTVEIKSGYGLNLDDEKKQLLVAQRLGERLPVHVVKTFLGAHAIPPEYSGQSDAYIKEVSENILPALHSLGLVDAVDAFCETIGFSLNQVEQVFKVANKLGLPVKLHAEQLSNMKGTQLASQYNALSVDHLEYLDSEGVNSIKKSGTVAVLLPGAFYCLRETKLPPIKLLRESDVPIAIATDSNPGSSPVLSLLLMLNMGCTFFKLTPEEALLGVTRNAASALGLAHEIGSLEVGKRADIVLWNISNPAQLSHTVGHLPCEQVMFRGVVRNV